MTTKDKAVLLELQQAIKGFIKDLEIRKIAFHGRFMDFNVLYPVKKYADLEAADSLTDALESLECKYPEYTFGECLDIDGSGISYHPVK